MASEYILVAVAWPYANADTLHIGHIAGAYLPADIFARYQRMLGNYVLQVSGTDMHGTPVSIKALKAGKSSEEFAQYNHERFVAQLQALGLDYEHYTNTHRKIHFEVVNNMGRYLYKKGILFPRKTKMLYDKKVRRVLPDRYVEGTCPYCGYRPARGDQCDNCGRVLDPLDLKEPVSKLSGTVPTITEVENLYLDLPRFAGNLRDYLESQKHWRPHVLETALGWLKEGLIPRPVTRNIEWGIPVDIDGFREQVWYVWFEAVIGYLFAPIEWQAMESTINVVNSADAEVVSEFVGIHNAVRVYPSVIEFWKYTAFNAVGDNIAKGSIDLQLNKDVFTPKEVKLNNWQYFWKGKSKQYYFIGKDNIPFHAVIWPIQIMAYNIKYSAQDGECLPFEKDGKELSTMFLNLPYDVPANQYLLLNDAKFSKSTGNFISVAELLEKFEVTHIRYAVARTLPESRDANFSYGRMKELVNNELVATIGNLYFRVYSLFYKRFGGNYSTLIPDVKLVSKVLHLERKYHEYMQAVQITRGLDTALEVAKLGNQYLNKTQPWQKNEIEGKQILQNIILLLDRLSLMLWPFIPHFVERVLSTLKVGDLIPPVNKVQ